MYYPRINNLFQCRTDNDLSSWRSFLKNSSEIDNYDQFKKLLINLQWTPQLAEQLQQFCNNASCRLIFGGGKNIEQQLLSAIPPYEDLVSEPCNRI
ncbi:unnamed protein product [Rotaria sp. Silwood2]|nr:unnamed protein product [Rotaria sp. Silwood2]CAF2739466.1 unnamed protein product [Rotaria sp. Silwood2]CAF3285640.1 unnamed protein product [Rotaria sp. Silwood2]CAF4107936.1 unnamed protein product [Rotaria sp. Silwood2]CAF4253044.1 unnamed protein product [Rotaria sp. Silwood2]